MKLPSTVALVAASLLPLTPAMAALEVGDKAPDFAIDASLGGSVYKFKLSEELKKGPVVLYFFPAAFSVGCTIEAHEFAEATERFKALGAAVIGVSHDDLDTLKRFSVAECRSKFPVGADVDQSVMKSYDATLSIKPEYANRTSYVIGQNGIILYQYTSLNPFKHVNNTLNALKTSATAAAAAVAPKK